MSLIGWNYRGAGNVATVRELHDFARRFAPAVFGVVETQTSKSRAEALGSSIGYDSSFAIGSSGRSGGLVLFWNKEIKLEILGYSCYHIDAKVEGLGSTEWRVTLVYSEAQVAERYKMWNTLKDLAGHINIPWVTLGDFNEALHLSEYDGIGNRRQAQIDEFRDAADVCALQDLGHNGTIWIFEKKVAGGTYTRARLDRAMAVPGWSMLFPNAAVDHLTCACSDHSPILLKLNAADTNKKRLPKQF